MWPQSLFVNSAVRHDELHIFKLNELQLPGTKEFLLGCSWSRARFRKNKCRGAFDFSDLRRLGALLSISLGRFRLREGLENADCCFLSLFKRLHAYHKRKLPVLSIDTGCN
jgi:hypothetical protein